MTRLPAPDDQPHGNGQLRHGNGVGHPLGEPLEEQRTILASFWALVLRRFRTYTDRGSAVAGQDGQQEGR